MTTKTTEKARIIVELDPKTRNIDVDLTGFQFFNMNMLNRAVILIRKEISRQRAAANQAQRIKENDDAKAAEEKAAAEAAAEREERAKQTQAENEANAAAATEPESEEGDETPSSSGDDLETEENVT